MSKQSNKDNTTHMSFEQKPGRVPPRLRTPDSLSGVDVRGDEKSTSYVNGGEENRNDATDFDWNGEVAATGHSSHSGTGEDNNADLQAAYGGLSAAAEYMQPKSKPTYDTFGTRPFPNHLPAQPAPVPDAPQIYPTGQSPFNSQQQSGAGRRPLIEPHDDEPVTRITLPPSPKVQAPQEQIPSVTVQAPELLGGSDWEDVRENIGRVEVGATQPPVVERRPAPETRPPANINGGLEAVRTNNASRAQRVSPWKQRLFTVAKGLGLLALTTLGLKGVSIGYDSMKRLADNAEQNSKEEQPATNTPPEKIPSAEESTEKMTTGEAKKILDSAQESKEAVPATPESVITAEILKDGQGISQALLAGGVDFDDMMKALKNITVTVGNTTAPLGDLFVIARGGKLAIQIEKDQDGKVTRVDFYNANTVEPLSSQELAKYLAVADWRVEKSKRDEAAKKSVTVADAIDSTTKAVKPTTSALLQGYEPYDMTTVDLDPNGLALKGPVYSGDDGFSRAAKKVSDTGGVSSVDDDVPHFGAGSATTSKLDGIQLNPVQPVENPHLYKEHFDDRRDERISPAETIPEVRQFYRDQIEGLEDKLDATPGRTFSVGKLVFRRVGVQNPRYEARHSQSSKGSNDWVTLSGHLLQSLNEQYGLDFTKQVVSISDITPSDFYRLAQTAESYTPQTTEREAGDHKKKVQELEEAMRLTAKFGLPISELNEQYAALTGKAFDLKLTDEEMPTERVALGVVSPEAPTEPMVFADAATERIPKLPRLLSEDEPTERVVSREPSTVLMHQLSRVVDPESDTEPTA